MAGSGGGGRAAPRACDDRLDDPAGCWRRRGGRGSLIRSPSGDQRRFGWKTIIGSLFTLLALVVLSFRTSIYADYGVSALPLSSSPRPIRSDGWPKVSRPPWPRRAHGLWHGSWW